ncbi:MAG: hypothetical protein EOP93_23435 [Lysobacteraceae bacterium]|nr:MAG: hypothetical protein EOP93_23435 [Xanthomonadaceae bacterium]
MLKVELGGHPVPVLVLATTSYTADNGRREWTSSDALAPKVSERRIRDGVHLRTSNRVAREMGRKIGGMAAAKGRLARP